MAERKYNRTLSIAFIVGIIGFLLSILITRIMVNNIGSAPLNAYDACIVYIAILSGAIGLCDIIAIFISKRLLTSIALLIIFIGSIIFIVIPRPLVTENRITYYSRDFLSVGGIVILAISIASLLYVYFQRKHSIKEYFTIAIAAVIVSILVSFLMISVFNFGLFGAGFVNIIQPIAFLIPLLLFNKDEYMITKKESVFIKHKDNENNKSEYTYLEEYKRRKKG